MNALKVLHGNPSQEELAAVLAVLMTVGQQPESSAGSLAATPAKVTWGRTGRRFGTPAGSWKYAS
ncbi:acyl-CoA carboxylase subunit epsilon [Streptomyces sp. NPDC056452]|uniref:acyl-CoA carboxylase subunit epsilon n=1 Tax=Streptomyces sp. NPDC056452 TaxID=3345821 RepID=UPI003697CD36